ncbi:MAG TPA: hypothetical protein VGI81_00595 [Tepidisphaeraceae bacterium]|jgi:hypothetical protein
MAPHLILLVAGLTSAWAVLSIIGGERQRVLQNAELLRRAAAEADADEADNAAEQAAAKKPASSVPSVKKLAH